MREIKFRAWHKTEKKMCEVTTIVLGKGAFLLGLKPDPGYWADNKIYVHPVENGRFCKWDEFELMQYTGLKDKNGKDIYEGDIVEFPENQLQVKYSCPAFCLQSLSNNLVWHFDEMSSFGEIIGNIHENPELIKK